MKVTCSSTRSPNNPGRACPGAVAGCVKIGRARRPPLARRPRRCRPTHGGHRGANPATGRCRRRLHCTVSASSPRTGQCTGMTPRPVTRRARLVSGGERQLGTRWRPKKGGAAEPRAEGDRWKTTLTFKSSCATAVGVNSTAARMAAFRYSIARIRCRGGVRPVVSCSTSWRVRSTRSTVTDPTLRRDSLKLFLN